MPAKTTTFSTDVLKLIFNRTPIAGLADDAALGAVTSLLVGLHTADPGAAGDQTTNALAYTEYALVEVPRTTADWVVTSNSVSPAAVIQFPLMQSGAGGTATHWSVGIPGRMLYRGVCTPNIIVATGAVPRIGTGSTIVEQ